MNFFLYKNLLQTNLLLLIITTTVISLIFFFYKIYNFYFAVKSQSFFFYLRLILLLFLLISFFLHVITIWAYFDYSLKFYNLVLLGDINILPNYNFFFNKIFFNFNFSLNVDFFGLILLSLAYLVGFFSLLALDNRLYWKNIRFIYYFNIFLVIVFFYVSVSNLIFFFFLYECLLVPSFLLVYFVSPSRRAIQASLYFIIWTQVGSFFVLCVVAYLLSVTGETDFYSLKNFVFTNTEIWFIYLFLFFGFGFKVPIWPFHYWLTKTHVEAPAGFSMYLSGFLVKSALYGFYKISNILGGEISTIFFTSIAMMGAIDASLKMWGQTDLKKLVAYGTIQEMNLIFLVFLWGDSYSIVGGVLFCFTHAFLSTLMFYLVDCIQRRFHSRSVVELSGILNITPNLGVSILFMCIFFSGVPGTLKFVSEFYIFSGFLEISTFSCFSLILICNVFGLIGFSKSWFNVVFGLMTKNSKYLPIDLTSKEIFIIISCFLLLFLPIFITNFLF